MIEGKHLNNTKTEFVVNQVAHGLVVNKVVQMNGASWTLAQANNSDTLAVGVVSNVLNVDNFKVCIAGKLSGFVGLTAGEYYFVSDATAGEITPTEPTSYSNPIGLALSATELLVLPYRPSVSSAEKSYLLAGIAGANVTTNLTNGDHIKYNTVYGQVGTGATLDYTSSYSVGSGTALGRITLQHGRKYTIKTQVSAQLSAAGTFQFQVFDITAGAYIGMGGEFYSSNSTDTSSHLYTIISYMTPLVPTIIEIRLYGISVAINYIRGGGYGNCIEVIEV